MLPLMISAQVIEVVNGDGVTIYYNYTNDGKDLEVTYSDNNKYHDSVVIPSEVTYMSSTFKVTRIGVYAFQGCTSLTSVTIPNSVTSIGSYAFSGCTSLNTVTIPNSVTSIGSYAFKGCTSLNTVTIPNRVTSIGSSTFSGCTGLNTVTIPNSVTSIGSSAFYGCTGLNTVTIPNSVTSIGSSAFAECSGLTSVTLGNGITKIREGAFFNSGLTTITIPNSVTTIENGSFLGCSGLTSITFGNSVTNIERDAFENCRIEKIITKSTKTQFKNSYDSGSTPFSYATFQHAILYIPIGKWSEVVYESSWYRFNNIKEMASETNEVTPSRAFTLMDAQTFSYVVYDDVNQELCNKDGHYQIDESNPNTSWQIVNKDNKQFLYNIGARKYASLKDDGSLKLSDTPAPLNMQNGDKGIVFGNHQDRQWNFVLNQNVEPDHSTTAINFVESEDNGIYSIYSLGGNRIAQPKKGVNIVRMKNGTIKKIIVK